MLTFTELLNIQKRKSDDAYSQAVIDNQMKLDAARSNSLDNMIALGRGRIKGR